MKSFLVLSAVLLAVAALQPNQGNRILVLVDNLITKETHSMYFKGLVAEGFLLTFKVADDASINIKKYGSYLYDHLILFSPTVEEFGGALSAEVSIIEAILNHNTRTKPCKHVVSEFNAVF